MCKSRVEDVDLSNALAVKKESERTDQKPQRGGKRERERG